MYSNLESNRALAPPHNQKKCVGVVQSCQLRLRKIEGPITVWLPCYVQFLRRQDPLSRQRRLTFIAPITLNPVPVPDRGVVT